MPPAGTGGSAPFDPTSTPPTGSTRLSPIRAQAQIGRRRIRNARKAAATAPPARVAVPPPVSRTCPAPPKREAIQPMKANRTELARLNGRASHGASWPIVAASIPSHIEGATAGSASRLAATVPRGSLPKWKPISGRVARVAATVTETPSESASPNRPARPSRNSRSRSETGRARARIPTTAAKLSCQPTSPAEKGLRPRVRAAARTTGKTLSSGLSAEAAASPASPMTPARWIEGPLPARGT